MKKISLLLITLLLFFGCTLAQVRVNVVSERTALENQVLGSYNSLSEDVLLVASVRGVDPLGRIKTPPRKSREYQDTVGAVETLSFHADDVDTFKRLRWVGENNQGLLTTFPMDKKGVPEDLKEFAARYQANEFNTVVQEVNRAREAVILRVTEINENLTKEDLPKIRKVFGKLNRENALPGEKVQAEDGSWMIKP
jgi:uncharacterized protein YdbL (DUF1318 family)